MIDYTTVTEIPGSKATQEQLTRLCTRYYTAANFCQDKDVLEVGCGCGIGLGYLAKRARRIVGGDYTENVVKHAQSHYRERIPLLRLDAHELPFKNNCFDVIILYESIYYLKHPEYFVEEASRVLRKGGVLIICTVNKDWADFNPSPCSVEYFSAPELLSLLKHRFSEIKFYGAFSTSNNTSRDSLISAIKRMAIGMHLIPKTMKGKEFFKRIFFGKLTILPQEIKEGMAECCEPVAIPHVQFASKYKVLYALAYV
ncbi:class I SAM-dependent methyltransferase [Candidatus Omnitrophota bacterium]